MWRVLSAATIICLCCAGCGTPGWIDCPPASRGYIYAVGRWPKAYYANQRRQAADDARAEIARTLHSEVNELVLTVETGYGPRLLQRMQRVLSSITATDLEGCEVMKYWKDENGRAGPEGTLYALARISREDAAQAVRDMASASLAGEEQGALDRILQRLKSGPGPPE